MSIIVLILFPLTATFVSYPHFLKLRQAARSTPINGFFSQLPDDADVGPQVSRQRIEESRQRLQPGKQAFNNGKDENKATIKHQTGDWLSPVHSAEFDASGPDSKQTNSSSSRTASKRGREQNSNKMTFSSKTKQSSASNTRPRRGARPLSKEAREFLDSIRQERFREQELSDLAEDEAEVLNSAPALPALFPAGLRRRDNKTVADQYPYFGFSSPYPFDDPQPIGKVWRVRCPLCRTSVAQAKRQACIAGMNKHVKIAHKHVRDFSCLACEFVTGCHSTWLRHMDTCRPMIRTLELHTPPAADRNATVAGDGPYHGYESPYPLQEPILRGQVWRGVCPLCPKAVRNAYRTSCIRILNQHVKIVHEKVKDVRCPKCNFTTGVYTALGTHLKTVHHREGKRKPESCKGIKLIDPPSIRPSVHHREGKPKPKQPPEGGGQRAAGDSGSRSTRRAAG